MIIRNPVLEELDEILDVLNNEFIINKGKKLHIKYRYPGLYDQSNIENLFVIHDDNKLRSFIAVKPVDYIYQNKTYKLFFIGSVFTYPESRGKGYGSKLLDYIEKYFFDNEYSMGCLWSGIPIYYMNKGWDLCENGIFAKIKVKDLITGFSENKYNYHIKYNEEIDYYKMDDFRINNKKDMIIRSYQKKFSEYGNIYSPGEEKIISLIETNDKIKGYIYGVMRGKTLIVYELIGDINPIRHILNEIANTSNLEDIYINLPTSKESILESISRYSEKSKPSITLYKTQSNYFDTIKRIYIPFTDRI